MSQKPSRKVLMGSCKVTKTWSVCISLEVIQIMTAVWGGSGGGSLVPERRGALENEVQISQGIFL